MAAVTRTLWQASAALGLIAILLGMVLGVAKVQGGVPGFYFSIGSWLLIVAVLAGIANYGLKHFYRDFIESIRIAAAQILANKMRSALTALGVIIGIVAVTLMGTAIKGIDVGVDRSFSGFGDDVLYVTKWPWRDVEDWWNFRNRRSIRHEYSRAINDWIATNPGSALKVAVPAANTGSTIVRGDNRVNNIWTLGTSSDYTRITRSDLKEGRFFSDFEAQSGSNVVVIGFDVAAALFPNESPLGKTIRVRGHNLQVLGVAAKQGSFLGLFSWDSMVVMPLTTFRRYLRLNDDSEIRVQVDDKRMAEARDELRGLMRRIRQLGPEQRDDFEINEQGTIREQIDPVKNGIFIAGLVITSLALFVGAIGIMNITYVSVKERTKEIGTRKALGARRRTILMQFLIEATSICLVGGAVGLAVTGGFAWLGSVAFPSFPLVFSTGLIIVALSASVFVGIASGFAPAWQASKLDPVVALRYE